MDMLIKLYNLPAAPAAPPAALPTAPRKPLAPEHDLLARWIEQSFTPGWASEARVALANRPISQFIAASTQEFLGFCCYDATARGLVGPSSI